MVPVRAYRVMMPAFVCGTKLSSLGRNLTFFFNNPFAVLMLSAKLYRIRHIYRYIGLELGM